MIVLDNLPKLSSFLKAQLLLGFFVFWSSCSSPRDFILLSGQTMGTTYSVKIITEAGDNNNQRLQNGIDSILAIVNNQMSTWDPHSEISRFNHNQSDTTIAISPGLLNVLEISLKISKLTDGAFDVTIFDLMSLWGFGPKPLKNIPLKDDIEKVLSYTGWTNIKLVNSGIVKQNPKIKLDLNSIAKGYGVDQVFNWIKTQGYENVFVEIGGEVRCNGRNHRNKLWSIGVENPIDDFKETHPFAGIIYSDGDAVATSGNYRNFVNLNGEILGHTINPLTGFPIKSKVLSVTVLSKTCMVADAWATALMVLDYETGSKLVNDNTEIEAIWILKKDDGTRRVTCSDDAKLEDSLYEIIR